MMGQEMHVRWKHHQMGLMTCLRQMLSSEAFVDVSLCCQNRRLKAHRVLLSACSPYLQKLLMAHPTADHTTIILDDIAFVDMQSLLDFVYTGGVTVPEERLQSFLEAAKILQITVLTDKNLHQQVPTKMHDKNLPPLIKVHQERSFYSPNCHKTYKDPTYVVNQNGYKNEFKTAVQENMDYDQLKPNGPEVKPVVADEDLFKVKDEQKIQLKELDFVPDANYGGPTMECKPLVQSPRHLCSSPKTDHIHNNVNKFDTSSSGSSPSYDPTEFQWVRPLPSLMPISASTAITQRRLGVQTQKHPRKSLGGILTPSPWAQNGRPPVGAPRVMRSPSRGSERSVQNEDFDHPERRPNSSPNYVDSNGTLPGSPRLQDTSSRSDGDSSSEPPSLLRENDENRPDVMKLCRLKERRLQEFYREQMLNNGSPLKNPPDDNLQSDLSFKQPLLLEKIQRYSEQPFNFPNRLHHISRILGADNGISYQAEVNPIHGLKTLASLIEDNSNSNSSCSTDIQRGKSLSCSDLSEDTVRGDSNNNEGVVEGARCGDCGKVFDSGQNLEQHRQSQECLTCGECGKQFSQRSQWVQHQKLHEDTRQEHACTHCTKTFVTRASLKVHLRTHTGEKPFHCLECGKQFSQLRNYKYHRSVHEGTREFAATCPECGKYFNDRGYLSSHMKIHRNRKEYGCEYCGKSFNQRVAYNMHVRIHTGEKPHVCPHCSKSFSRKMLLKQHLRIHTGEKPFQCVVCQKAFADRSNMTLHMRLHSGVKPYTCSVCSKSFTKKHHLKTHMNYHTGVKPYSCSKCGLRFSQSSNMRTHFKKCSSTVYPPPNLGAPVSSLPLNMSVTPPNSNSDESSCATNLVKGTV